jgi:hypothetical protein
VTFHIQDFAPTLSRHKGFYLKLQTMKKTLIIIIIYFLIAFTLASLVSCSTREAPEERVTISYELITGSKGRASWLLPEGAELQMYASRGSSSLHWRKGQSMWGVLKHNVVDYQVTDRKLTGKTYVNEDALRQDLIYWIGGLTILVLVLWVFWPEIVRLFNRKVIGLFVVLLLLASCSKDEIPCEGPGDITLSSRSIIAWKNDVHVIIEVKGLDNPYHFFIEPLSVNEHRVEGHAMARVRTACSEFTPWFEIGY